MPAPLRQNADNRIQLDLRSYLTAEFIKRSGLSFMLPRKLRLTPQALSPSSRNKGNQQKNKKTPKITYIKHAETVYRRYE